MKSKAVLILIFSFAMLSCGSMKEKGDKQQEPVTATCYIHDLTKHEDGHLLRIIYMDFLHDDEAIEAARRAGDAIEDIDEDGNIEYSLPNDYDIAVTDESVHEFKISDTTKFTAWAYSDEEGMYQKELNGIDEFIEFYSIRELNSAYREIPFTIQIKEGSIIEVKEEYVP